MPAEAALQLQQRSSGRKAAAAEGVVAPAGSGSSLLQLPDHLLLLVICLVGLQCGALSPVSKVCSKLHRAVKTDYIWRQFFSRRFLPKLTLSVKKFYGIPESQGVCSSSNFCRSCNRRDTRRSSVSCFSRDAPAESSSGAAAAELPGYDIAAAAGAPDADVSPEPQTRQFSWFGVYTMKHCLERKFSSGLFDASRELRVAQEGVSALDVLLLSGGSCVAFATADGLVGVACTDTGETLAALSPKQQHGQQQQGTAAAVALAHAGREEDGQQQQQLEGRLVAGYADGYVRLWSLAKKRLAVEWAAHGEAVHALCLVLGREEAGSASCGDSRDSFLLCTASASGSVSLWDVGALRPSKPLAVFAGHEATVLSLAFHRHSNLVLSGSKDRVVFGFDPREGRRPAMQLSHADWISSLEAASSLLQPHLIRSGDKKVHAWDLRNPRAPLPQQQHKQHRHRQLVSGVRSDELRLVSCSLDGSVLISSLETSVESSSGSCCEVVEEAAAAAAAEFAAQAAAAFPRALGQQHCDWLLGVDFTETKLAAAAANGIVKIFDFCNPREQRRRFSLF